MMMLSVGFFLVLQMQKAQNEQMKQELIKWPWIRKQKEYQYACQWVDHSKDQSFILVWIDFLQ